MSTFNKILLVVGLLILMGFFIFGAEAQQLQTIRFQPQTVAPTCTTGQAGALYLGTDNVLRVCSGSAWSSVDTDTNSGGTITGVTAGTGLSGGGASGNVTLSVAYGSTSGTAAQGSVTLTGPAGGTGLSGGGGSIAVGAGGTFSSISLNTAAISTCTGSGQKLLWDSTNNRLTCGTDIDTNSGGTITGVTAGTGLSGGGTSGNVTLAAVYGSIAGTAVQGNTTITISAGTGMTGGGAITLGSGGSVTLTNADLGSSQSIFKSIANSAAITQFSAGSNNDALQFAGSGATSVAFDGINKRITFTSTDTNSGGTITAVTAGSGLTGGGTSGAVTLDIGAGTGISVAADAISVLYGSTASTAAQGNVTLTGPSAGTGLSGGGGSIAVGAGGTFSSISLNTAAISTCTGSGQKLLWDSTNNRLTCGTDIDTNSGGTVTGTGTGANYISKWTSTTALGTSLIYDNGTNVGIGTASPSGKGSGAAGPFINIEGSGTNSPELYLGNSATTTGGNVGAIGGYSGASSADKRAALIGFELDGSSVTSPVGRIVFWTNNAGTWGERMRIDKSGNVGIGTTGPNGLLNINGVYGTNNIGVKLSASGTEKAFFAIGGYGLGGVDNDDLIIRSAEDVHFTINGASPVVTIKNTGNVGIGTTGPDHRFAVEQLLDTTGAMDTAQVLIGSETPTNGATYIGYDTTDKYGFIQSGRSAISWDPLVLQQGGGNVGIGTASPSYKLEVADADVVATGGTEGYIGLFKSLGSLPGYPTNRYPTLKTDAGYLYLSASSTYSGYVYGSGIAAIQFTDLNDTTYYVNPAGATSAVFAGTVSASTFSGDLSCTNCISNAELANSSLTVSAGTGLSGGGVVSLGGSTSLSLNLGSANTWTATQIFAAVGTDIVADKIDAGTIDPIYTIGAAGKFATYLPGMTGVKEETTGVVKLQAPSTKLQTNSNDQNSKCLEFGICDLEFTEPLYEYVIDFNKVESGSDLWLFWQTTDFGLNWDNLAVLLTPNFEGKVWYEKKPDERKLVIYASPAALQPCSSDACALEVSYRLTAPRFDYAKWPNISTGESEGFVIEEK